MPNTKQSSKRLKQDEKRRVHNKAMTSAMRTAIKKVLQAETPDAAEAATPLAFKRIDKAAKRNIIHANTAANSKRRLAKAVTRMRQPS